MTEVTGRQELSLLGHRLREADRKDLMRELRRGLSEGMKPLGDLVLENIPPDMPKGYEATLAEAMQFKTAVNTSGQRATVEFKAWAKGKRGARRKVKTLNNPGLLRHPVYGRYRRVKKGYLIKNPWVDQHVKPGFFDDAADANKENLRHQAREAIRNVANKITKD
jgi:hypothetical protein